MIKLDEIKTRLERLETQYQNNYKLLTDILTELKNLNKEKAVFDIRINERIQGDVISGPIG